MDVAGGGRAAIGAAGGTAAVGRGPLVLRPPGAGGVQPRRRLRVGIRGKIATVILICMVPVLILGGVFYYARNQERRSLVLRTQQDAAGALVGDVETFLTNAVHAERAAGAAVTSQPYPVIGIVQLFSAIRQNDPAFLSLALAQPDGHVDAADPPGGPQAMVAGHRAFDAVRGGAPSAIGAVGLVNGTPAVEVATGINEHGRLVAVVDGIVDLSQLRTVLPTAFAPDMDGIILDEGGRVVLDLRRPDRPPEAFRSLAAVRAALAGTASSIEGYRDARTGTRELGAAVPIPALGWAAIVLEPEATALGPIRAAATQELLLVLSYAALGLILAWVLGGELSAPILALARGARAIGRGGIGYRVGLRRTDELGELGAAFDEMSAQLKRSVDEMNALQAVSDAALSTVELRRLLPALLQRIVSALGGEGGTVWFVDETTGELAIPAEFDGGRPGSQPTRRLRPGQGAAGRVASGGRTLVIAEREGLRAFDPDLPDGVQSAVGVPLRVGGKVIGVIQVFSRRAREFRPAEVRLLETFADRVALAVDNARAYERQQEIAGVIQQALVPTRGLRLPGLTIAGRYQPSREVGGDFYAVLPLDDGQAGIAIADVAGKGIPAATLSARCRYLLEAFALDRHEPGAVLARLNAVFQRDAVEGMFVSLFYGVLDPAAGTFRFSNAGHHPPLLLPVDAPAPVAVQARGLLLGVDAGARYATAEARVAPGDLLLLYTDGITEARNAQGDQFGEMRLRSLLASLRDAPAEEIADRIMDAVRAWSGSGPSDDQAFVVARLLPAEPAG